MIISFVSFVKKTEENNIESNILYSILPTIGIFTTWSIFKKLIESGDHKKLIKTVDSNKVIEIQNTILKTVDLAKNIKKDLENLKNQLSKREYNSCINIDFIKNTIRRLDLAISIGNSFYNTEDYNLIKDYRYSLLKLTLYTGASLGNNLMNINKQNPKIQKIIDKYNTNELIKTVSVWIK